MRMIGPVPDPLLLRKFITVHYRQTLGLKDVVFWDITPCGSSMRNRRIGGTYRLHLQHNKALSLPSSRDGRRREPHVTAPPQSYQSVTKELLMGSYLVESVVISHHTGEHHIGSMTAVFWDVIDGRNNERCRLLGQDSVKNWRFGGTYCLHLQVLSQKTVVFDPTNVTLVSERRPWPSSVHNSDYCAGVICGMKRRGQ
jgi:hypothetical protein